MVVVEGGNRSMTNGQRIAVTSFHDKVWLAAETRRIRSTA